MITFNGIDLAAYFGQINGQDVFSVNEIRGRGPISQETTRISVPNRAGSYFQNRRMLERVISVRITLKSTSLSDLRTKVNQLNGILSVNEPVPIVFSDEPDKTYYGILDGEPDWNEIVYFGQGTLTFLCPDPYAYGTERTQTISVPPATFARNSVAYNEDGTQVAADEPRFVEVEAGNSGVLIEEGTTNIIPSASALSLSSSWTSGTLNGTYTLSVRGGSGTVDISGGYTGSVAVGSSVTFTVSSATITLSPNGGMPEFVQLEEPYATSFIDGTRSSETLIIPATGVMNPQEGTVECWVYVNDIIKRVDGIFRTIWYSLPVSGTANGWLILDHFGNRSSWRISVNNGSTSANYSVSDSYTPIGWHLFSLTYNAISGDLRLYIDGVLRFSTAGAPLPSSYDKLFVGLAQEGTRHCNALIDDLRISRIARTDEEIADTYNNGFAIDEHTTAYMDFEGNLVVQAPNTVDNRGTAETYPVFSVTLTEPITYLEITNHSNISPQGAPRAVILGQASTPEDTEIEREELVFHDTMQSTSSWQTASEVDNGYIAGEMAAGADGFYPRLYGAAIDNKRWQGPSLIRAIGTSLQDFRADIFIKQFNVGYETGMIEIYFRDANGNRVAKIGFEDPWVARTENQGKAEFGNRPNDHRIYTQADRPHGWNNFDGIIRLERVGNVWRPYFAKIVNGRHDWVRSTLRYTDNIGHSTAPITHVQVAIRKYPATEHTDQSVREIRIYRINEPEASQNEVGYIANAGDTIEIENATGSVRLNGEPRLDLVDINTDFFTLVEGVNRLSVAPDISAEVRFRKRYL